MPGVAVVADSTWAAFKGRDALVVEWAEGAFAAESSATLSGAVSGAARQAGVHAARHGQRRAGAGRRGARASTTPTNSPSSRMRRSSRTTAPRTVRDGECYIRRPAADAGVGPEVVAQALGIPRETACTCSPRALAVALAGGCCRTTPLKRRSYRARLARLCRSSTTAPGDLQHDYYRPAAAQRIRAGADASGRLIAWDHVVASVSRNAYRKDPRPPFSTETYGSVCRPRDARTSEIDPDLQPTRIAHARLRYGAPRNRRADRRLARALACGERVCHRDDDRRARRGRGAARSICGSISLARRATCRRTPRRARSTIPAACGAC